MDAPKDDLTVQQAAAAMSCSEHTVLRLIADGLLSAYRLGGLRGHWRIRPQALDEFRKAQETPK